MGSRHWRRSTWLGCLLTLLYCSAAHAGTHYYYYTDPQGTVLAKADAQGNIVETYDYAPYGSVAMGVAPNGPGYTGHVTDAETGLVYMQARYYDPVTARFLSIDPTAPTAGNTFNFNRYTYANNNPVRFIDPDGRKCATVDGKVSCTYDEFTDKNGKTVSREQAMSSGSGLAKFFHMDRGSRIRRAEAAMTAKYSAAESLAAKGGEVTIKGNGTLGIPDKTISASTIVSHMETIQTIANASPNSANPNMIAASPIDRAHLGAPSNGPITFYRDGAGPSNPGQIFGHEILHTIYSGAGLSNGGWANPDFNNEHQTPFNDASDAIQ